MKQKNEYEDFDDFYVIAPIRFKKNHNKIYETDQNYNFANIFYKNTNNSKFQKRNYEKEKLRKINFYLEVFAGTVITLSYIIFAVILMYTLTSNYLDNEDLLNVKNYKASNIRCEDLNIPMSVQLLNKEICNIK